MKITGYADKISARPGETVQFMVNCELPEYRAEVVRIVCGDENPAGPSVKERRVRTAADGVYPGRRQTIESGSYAVVTGPDGEAGRSVLDGLESFSVQAMIWPTTPQNGTQVLVSKWQDRRKSGFALLIHEGRPRPATSGMEAVTSRPSARTGRCSNASGISWPRPTTRTAGA